MRVVIDTNVIISALRGKGSASAIVDACMAGRCVPLMSDALFLEYAEVLGRDGLFAKSTVASDERFYVMNAFAFICVWTRVSFLWRPNLPDEADNHILELAVAGNASMIVTYNIRDFIRQEIRFPDIAILKPHELRRRLSL